MNTYLCDLLLSEDLLLGHVVDMTWHQTSMTLRGKPSSDPPELHACVVGTLEPPRFWDITLDETYIALNVMQQFPNSDNLTLTKEYNDWIENTINTKINKS